jgi:arginine-tRNA-protein transferase
MDDIIFFFNTPANMVQDVFFADKLTLRRWDKMLAEGWRHNGMMFFRTSHDMDEDNNLRSVMPLRYVLKKLTLTKSQRIIFNRNQDLQHIFRPTVIDDEKHELFFKHTEKFDFRRPVSIWDFISPQPQKTPFKTWELCVYKEDKLVACSFLDITSNSISSTYAMYDLDESKRSLGTYTMILEVLRGIATNKKYYYPGYVYDSSSFYDYKKRFNNKEYFDWHIRRWVPYNVFPESLDAYKNVEKQESKIFFV